MTVKIKICGITSQRDALAAVEAGADALGFVFYNGSPRYVPPPMVARITRVLPPFVATVGVFVDASEAEIQATVNHCGLSTVQLHGEETPEFCRRFSVTVIKAFRLKQAESLNPLPDYDTSAWLLDSYVPGHHGGTGAVFNWDLACQAKKWKRPIILAGGLTPGNVTEAVRQVLPFGVDVSSGVEERPGLKDLHKLHDFIVAVRRAVASEPTDSVDARDWVGP
jgi:phosphoribosylanthranilate isomerase